MTMHFELIVDLNKLGIKRSNELAINYILTCFSLDRTLSYTHGLQLLLPLLFLSLGRDKDCYDFIKTEAVPAGSTGVEVRNADMLKDLPTTKLDKLSLHNIVSLLFIKCRILISLELIQCFDTFLLGTSSHSHTPSSPLQRLAGHVDLLSLIRNFHSDSKYTSCTPKRAVLRTITPHDLTSELSIGSNTHYEPLDMTSLKNTISDQVNILYDYGIQKHSTLWTALTSPPPTTGPVHLTEEDGLTEDFEIAISTITDTVDSVVGNYRRLYSSYPEVLVKLKARLESSH